MKTLGFSTGALAKGDFFAGIELQRHSGVNAVELSALRESEVDNLVNALDDLDLAAFTYISFHAPSRLHEMTEADLVQRLHQVAERNWPIVVHPDIIQSPSRWRALGSSVLIENMDQRKGGSRTASDLEAVFAELPEARFCFDAGHARQVDPTMSIAANLLLRYGDRLSEIHLSEVNTDCRHVSITAMTILAFRRIASLVPAEIPVILESMVHQDGIAQEIELAHRCFAHDESAKWRSMVG
jgi:hypothetical protein